MDLFLIKLIVALAAFFGVFVYIFFKWKHSYWQRKCIPHEKPNFFYGNLKTSNSNEPFFNFIRYLYEKYKNCGKFCGLYIFIWRAVIITDLDLAKNVLKSDGKKYFHDRGIYFNEKDDPLSGHLVHLCGEKWKLVRDKLRPAFSNIKMKSMFAKMIEVSDRFKADLRRSIEINNELEMKEILDAYTIDVIAACAFGINADDKFRRMCHMALEKQKIGSRMNFFLFFNRWFGHLFKIKQLHEQVAEYFLKFVRDSVQNRAQSNEHQDDFMDLLCQIKNDGSLSLKEISAQATAFFTAGFDTISIAILLSIFELAKNPHIQKRARDEIETVLRDFNGELNYDATTKMLYLDQIISGERKKKTNINQNFIFNFLECHVPHFVSYRNAQKISTVYDVEKNDYRKL